MNQGVIVPVFLPYAGCKRRCVFCDQHAVSGHHDVPSLDEMESLYDEWSKRGRVCEIAFYGGTITALEKKQLIEYLSWAHSKLGNDGYIRISTRPDEIDEETISILKEFGVRHVEVGVQSFDNRVLKASNRGHTAGDSERAIRLLKSSGFTVGAHLMIGLPESTPSSELYSAQRLVELKVDTCRIHPTLVFEATPLHRMFERGLYEPLSLEDAVKRTANLYALLQRFGVKVIRLGLFLESNALTRLAAGPHHPAFGHMVKSRAFYEVSSQLATVHLEIVYSERYESIVSGYKRENIKRWESEGLHISLIPVKKEGILNVNGVDMKWVV